MIHLGIHYDYIIRLRPDMAVLAPMPPILELVTENGVTKYVDESICCCGNEDWFGIGTSAAMLPYLERFLTFQTLGHTVLPTPGRFEDGSLHAERPWPAEIFLERYMKPFFNVSIEPDSRLAGCFIKPKSWLATK